jgi:hypothetical protein
VVSGEWRVASGQQLRTSTCFSHLADNYYCWKASG